MSSLEEIPSPVADLSDHMEQVSTGKVQFSDLSGLTLIRVEVEPWTAAAHRMQKAMGVEFPAELGQVTGDRLAYEILHGTRQVVACLWVRGNVFLVVSRVDPAKLGRTLNAALGNDSGLVIDVSYNRTVLQLSGADAEQVLARTVCFEEQAPAHFLEGTAFRCVVGGAKLMLWRVDRHTYLMVPRNSHAEPVVATFFQAIEEVTGD